MPHSHHSHSGQFCKHAFGTLEQVVLEAIKQGFKVYGLTEHVPRYRPEDFYPEEKDLTPEHLHVQFTDFLDEAHRLKTLYASQITLLVGLETESITPLDLEGLSAILASHEFRIEYIVGSVHHVNGIPVDFDLDTFNRCLSSFPNDKMNSLLCSYFDAQHTLLERFKPEIVGHFDLCRLYHPSLVFSDHPEVVERIHRNVKLAVEYGALFEVNAAAFRKGWDAAYPGEDVVQIILRYGGRFALSDDSHGPHAVGLNYHRVQKYLQRMGVKELWFLQRLNGGEVSSAGRAVQAVKYEGEWWNDVFWEERKVEV